MPFSSTESLISSTLTSSELNKLVTSKARRVFGRKASSNGSVRSVLETLVELRVPSTRSRDLALLLSTCSNQREVLGLLSLVRHVLKIGETDQMWLAARSVYFFEG